MEELNKTELETQADVVKEGRNETEEKTTEEKIEESQESPMEKVERLNQETQKNLEALRKETAKIERLVAEVAISGRGFAGQRPKEKTQEENDQEEADKVLKMFR